MGIIATVTPKINDSRSMISRKTDVTSEEISRVGRINIHFYSPSKNVRNSVIYEYLPCIETTDPTQHVDILWKTCWLLKPVRPGWNGLMQLVHQGNIQENLQLFFFP